MRFAERLKDLRMEKGWTQKTLAEKLRITDDCVHFWEKGRSEPSIEQIVTLSNLFEVSTDYLLGKSEEY